MNISWFSQYIWKLIYMCWHSFCVTHAELSSKLNNITWVIFCFCCVRLFRALLAPSIYFKILLLCTAWSWRLTETCWSGIYIIQEMSLHTHTRLRSMTILDEHSSLQKQKSGVYLYTLSQLCTLDVKQNEAVTPHPITPLSTHHTNFMLRISFWDAKSHICTYQTLQFGVHRDQQLWFSQETWTVSAYYCQRKEFLNFCY